MNNSNVEQGVISVVQIKLNVDFNTANEIIVEINNNTEIKNMRYILRKNTGFFEEIIDFLSLYEDQNDLRQRINKIKELQQDVNSIPPFDFDFIKEFEDKYKRDIKYEFYQTGTSIECPYCSSTNPTVGTQNTKRSGDEYIITEVRCIGCKTTIKIT